MLDVIAGDEAAAIESMAWACRGSSPYAPPSEHRVTHLAENTSPTVSICSAVRGAMFDLCNFAGQRVTHVGRGEIGVRLFEEALWTRNRNCA